MAVIKTGRYAHLQASHGGQKQVVAGGEYGTMAAVHDGDQWRRYNRNGSTTRKPEWTDDDALAHGEKRFLQDNDRARKAAKKAELDRIESVFSDRRNQQLYPSALKKF